MKRIRAVLHAHSTWSYDGTWTLEQIARAYGAFGIDAVMMTEHDTGFDPARFEEYRAACANASTKRCTLIPGIEYSSPDNDIHILTWGLGGFLAEHRPVFETLRAVETGGGVAIFAHPIRREAWRSFEDDWVPYLSGIELWNRKSDGFLWGAEAWNLIQRTGLPATLGQDFHNWRQFYPLTHLFDLHHDDDLETGMVATLRSGRSSAQAFRRPVLGEKGIPAHMPYKQMEKARRSLRNLRLAKQGRRS